MSLVPRPLSLFNNAPMSLLYRFLGVAAYVTERASRTRGNGVPMNWLILVLLGFFLAWPIHEAIEVKNNEGDPIHASITDATNSDKLLDRYIIVTGQLHPEESVTETENGKVKDEDISWVPLIDPEGRKAIYIKTNINEPNRGVISRVEGSQSSFGAPPRVSVSGMLRKIPTDLQSAVHASSTPIGGISMNSQYMIVAGSKPSGLYLWLAVAIAIAIPILLMLLVIFKRYIVFRPVPSIGRGIDRFPPPPTQEPLDLRTTARFVLQENIRKLFHRVPSVLAQLESGDMAILANVDASSSFMGRVTKNRAGIWAAVIRNQTLSSPEYGTLYFGLTAYPAFRIRYTDGVNSKPATAILASLTPEGLQHIRQALYEPHLLPASPIEPQSPAPAAP